MSCFSSSRANPFDLQYQHRIDLNVLIEDVCCRRDLDAGPEAEVLRVCGSAWFKGRTSGIADVSLNLPTFRLFLSMASETALWRCTLGAKEPT